MAETKIIFFGSDDFSVTILDALLASNYQITAVVAQPDKPAGRQRQLTPPRAASYAQQHELQLLQPTKLRDITDQLAALDAQAAVVASYGRLIPPELLALYGRRFINVHPSLLPLYRGAAPIEYPILNGDPETGVTIMQVVDEMDAGDIIAQERLPLNGTETRPQLYQQLAEIGARQIIDYLPKVLDGSATYTPQDHAQATFTTKINKADGAIDWTKPAKQIEREIRAYLGWPGSYTKLGGKDVIITASHVTATPGVAAPSTPGVAYRLGRDLSVVCGQDSLVIDQLKPAGKREMTGQEFLAGHNKLLGL